MAISLGYPLGKAILVLLLGGDVLGLWHDGKISLRIFS
jgi:hypothetical protein